jgi:pilus assembly protein CpaB
MRRGSLFIILAVLLILGLLVLLVVWRFVILPSQQQAVQPSATTVPQVQILVVSQTVPKGTQLTQDMLAAIPWQQNALAPGMYKAAQINEVVGRIVKFDVPAGTPLLSSMLLTEGEQISSTGSPWALSIPPGMVAVSIPMNRLSSVSYAPRPGDHVNVILSMLFVDVDTDFQSITPNKTGVVIASGPPDPTTGERSPLTVDIASGIYGKTIIDPVLGQAVYVMPSEPQRPRLVSSMLLQDVVVLQVGDFPLEGQAVQPAAATPTPAPANEQGQQQAAPPPLPNVITLIVTPQDAVSLNYIMLAQSQMSSQLSMVLRSANDASREKTLPVTLGFLLEQYQIPVPAKLPYSLNPRIDALAPIELPVTQPTQ